VRIPGGVTACSVGTHQGLGWAHWISAVGSSRAPRWDQPALCLWSPGCEVLKAGVLPSNQVAVTGSNLHSSASVQNWVMLETRWFVRAE
jgi:hypothetical protein